MSEDTVRKLLLENSAGLSKTEIWKLSSLSNKKLQATINSMIRRKELILYSNRIVLNNPDCVKACLLDISMQNICSVCNRLEISRKDINEDRMKAWIDTYVDGMKWKNGKLITKLKKDIWEVADLHNIMEILAE